MFKKLAFVAGFIMCASVALAQDTTNVNTTSDSTSNITTNNTSTNTNNNTNNVKICYFKKVCTS